MSSELRPNLIALNTIVYREVRRFMRIWPQTLLPPAITMVLYFVIFGNLIGRQIGDMGGFTYMEYIVPGLIMMSVITNSYGNVVSSFFGSKFQRSIEELMVSPVSPHTILIGYTVGGILRGLMVGVIVTLLSLFFTHLQVHHLGLTVAVVLLTHAATADQQAGAQEVQHHGRHHHKGQGHADFDVRHPQNAVAEGVHHVQHRVGHRHRLPERRQQRDRIEHPAQISQRREYKRRNDRNIIEIACKHGVNEAQQRKYGRRQ